MKLSDREKNVSDLQLLLGFSAFYVCCLFENVSGILYPVFLFGMIWLYGFLMERGGRRIKKESRRYLLAVLLLGISTFLTGNPVIIWLNRLAVWLLWGMVILHDGREDQNWSVFRYMGDLLDLAVTVLTRLFAVFPELARSRRERQRESGTENRKHDKLIYVILGLLLGATLICLILPLLISADAVFDQLLGEAFDFAVRILGNLMIPTKLIRILLMFLWGVMFFYGVYSAVKNRKDPSEEKDLRTQEPVLAITVLAVIGVVYLLFCMVQISYLFTGGFALPEEYSYAGFARQGFFQLLFVSGLNLLLVLAVLFAGVIRNIYRESFPLFRYSVAVVTVIYLMLSFSRMDAWIASYNIAHDQTSYLYELSTDASGPMLKAAKEGTAETEMTRAYFSMNEYRQEEYTGIRKFNVSEFLFRLRCREYFLSGMRSY